MNKLFVLLFGVLAIVSGVLYFKYNTKNVEAFTPQCCKWTEWVDVTECVAPCGMSEGTKTQERYCQNEKCTWVCPVFHFEWNDGKNSADVQYTKSSDPTKCHRPSDNDLRDVYGMDKKARDAFKREYKEWYFAKRECEMVTEKTESREIKCEAEIVECEPTITPTPTEAPKPTEEPRRDPSPASPPVCEAPAVTVAPSYTMGMMSRTDPDTIKVSWTVTDGHAQKYGVHYGMSEDFLPWYAEFTGHETVEAYLNEVPAGHVWVKVCSIGTCGDSICGSIVDP